MNLSERETLEFSVKQNRVIIEQFAGRADFAERVAVLERHTREMEARVEELKAQEDTNFLNPAPKP